MNIQKMEVEWYKKNGRHKDRLALTGGKIRELYVIGDWGWNRKHPDLSEFIEQAMHFDIAMVDAHRAQAQGGDV